MVPLNLSPPVRISPGSPPTAEEAPGCLPPGWASLGPLPGPAAPAEAGRPHRARDRPWPATQRYPRGALPGKCASRPAAVRSKTRPTHPRPSRGKRLRQKGEATRSGRRDRPAARRRLQSAGSAPGPPPPCPGGGGPVSPLAWSSTPGQTEPGRAMAGLARG